MLEIARVKLDEAFYHERFGIVLWHHYLDYDEAFVMSVRLKDEARAQAFVDQYTEHLEHGNKPTFSAN